MLHNAFSWKNGKVFKKNIDADEKDKLSRGVGFSSSRENPGQDTIPYHDF